MKSSHSAIGDTKYIPALDSLRGIAILSVISYHYFPDNKLFSLNWSGVDLFFVLSGYLITGRLLSSLKEKNYFRKFYRNRLLRIFPLYYLVLMTFYLAILLFAKNENHVLLSYYTLHWKSFFFFTDNWSFIRFGLPHDAYLVHFWSLAIEEQYYLIWPVLILLIYPAKTRIKVLGISILLVILFRIVIYIRNPVESAISVYYYNTFCRVDSLLIGSVLKELHFRKVNISEIRVKQIATILTVILITGIVYAGSAGFQTIFMRTVGLTVIALLFACIIHATISSNGHLFFNILNHPGMQYFGKISFGLYIFHWPVLLILGTKIMNLGLTFIPDRVFLIKIVAVTVSFAFSFCLSAVSYRYFESYFLRFKKT